MAKVKNVKPKKAAQVLTVPAAAIVDNIDPTKNVSDEDKAKYNNARNGSPSKFRNHRRSKKGKGKGSPNKKKGPNTREDKRLRLPTPTDTAVQIIDGANDFANFTGELTEFASTKQMSPTLVDSLNLVPDPANPNNLIFPSYLPTLPQLDPLKQYVVQLEAKVASQSQIQALASSGAIAPNLATSTASSTSSSAKPSRSKTVPDPADIDEDMSSFEAIVINGEVLLIPKMKRFVTKSFTGAEIVQYGISCKEYSDDESKLKKDIEAYDKEVLKIKTELPSLAQKMWKLISKESQLKISKLMNCEFENAKNLIKFDTLRDHIRDTHHPSFHTANPNSRDFYASIEYYATNEFQNSKLIMTPKESLSDYKSRIYTLVRRLKTAASIGAKATAAGYIGFSMPSETTIIQRIINSINASSAPKAFELCSAYRGLNISYSPATPATVEALFNELEKVQAKVEPKQIARQKLKAEKEKFIASVNANFGQMDIPLITSMFTDGNRKRSRGGKPGKDGKPFQRADIKEALRVQIDPDKLDEKSSKYIFDAIKKKHPQFLSQKLSDDNKTNPKSDDKENDRAKSAKMSAKKFSKSNGRHRGRTVNAHHSTVSESDDSSSESSDEDENEGEDEDDEDSDSDLNEVLSNFNLMPSNLYHVLLALEIPNLSDSELVLMGLKDARVKSTKSRINYSRERFSRLDKFRNNKLSVSIEGAVVHDSGSGIHIIRDLRLLVKGSVRRISKEHQLKVQGTFPGAHVPKYFAVHKTLGFCIYDPQSKANIVSQSQAWASGWQYYTDNHNRLVFMKHPDHPSDVYKFEIGRENVLTGIDVVSFDTWDPTRSAKPTSVLSTLINQNVTKNYPVPNSLSPDELQFSDEEMLAFAFPTMTDHHGRQCSCTCHH